MTWPLAMIIVLSLAGSIACYARALHLDRLIEAIEPGWQSLTQRFLDHFRRRARRHGIDRKD